MFAMIKTGDCSPFLMDGHHLPDRILTIAHPIIGHYSLSVKPHVNEIGDGYIILDYNILITKSLVDQLPSFDGDNHDM